MTDMNYLFRGLQPQTGVPANPIMQVPPPGGPGTTGGGPQTGTGPMGVYGGGNPFPPGFLAGGNPIMQFPGGPQMGTGGGPQTGTGPNPGIGLFGGGNPIMRANPNGPGTGTGTGPGISPVVQQLMMQRFGLGANGGPGGAYPGRDLFPAALMNRFNM